MVVTCKAFFNFEFCKSNLKKKHKRFLINKTFKIKGSVLKFQKVEKCFIKHSFWD